MASSRIIPESHDRIPLGKSSVRVSYVRSFGVVWHAQDIPSTTIYCAAVRNHGFTGGTAMPPGTVLLMPPKMPHFAWTQEEVIFHLNVLALWTVTYVNPADGRRKE